MLNWLKQLWKISTAPDKSPTTPPSSVYTRSLLTSRGKSTPLAVEAELEKMLGGVRWGPNTLMPRYICDQTGHWRDKCSNKNEDFSSGAAHMSLVYSHYSSKKRTSAAFLLILMIFLTFKMLLTAQKKAFALLLVMNCVMMAYGIAGLDTLWPPMLCFLPLLIWITVWHVSKQRGIMACKKA